MAGLTFVVSSTLPFHLILPLASGLIYVAAALFLKRAIDAGADVWRTTRVCNVAAAALFAPLLLLGGNIPPLGQWWQPLFVALLFLCGQVLTMRALRVGDVSIATPVLGLKIILVAFFTFAVLGHRLPVGIWIAAALSSAGIALLQFSRPHTGGPVGPTILIAALAAAAYALFDVLVQKWSPNWGVGRFLPLMMAFAAVASFVLPSGSDVVRPASKPFRRWRNLGAACLALQALMLVSSIAIYRHAPVANVLYSSRGLWSVCAVWVAGRWLGSREGHHGASILAWRMAGATVLIVAIIVVAFDKP
jgi:drug/metabolite transporter (DMT)-like permease